MLLTALLASFVGMAWLALAMPDHWGQVAGGGSPTRGAVIALRTLGVLALLGSLALCLAVDHASMASLVWVMALAGAAVSVAMLLSWRPAWLRLFVPWRAGRTAE